MFLLFLFFALKITVNFKNDKTLGNFDFNFVQMENSSQSLIRINSNELSSSPKKSLQR